MKSPRPRRRAPQLVSRFARRRRGPTRSIFAAEVLEQRLVLSANDPFGIDSSPFIASVASDPAPPSAVPPFPLSETFELHSNPGADFVIYIDWDGHITSGTAWNTEPAFGFNGANIVSPRFDPNGNGIFDANEMEYIQRVWQRVAEDFAPFNVDVTTEDPGLERLRKTGAFDTQWGIRVVQTPDSSWNGAGGIAYLGSFSWDSDTPAFSHNGSFGMSSFDEAVCADTISHEVGHTLGLSHDGVGTTTYYGGQGTGVTSWAPIMGAFFADGTFNNVTQWSRGDYTNANQTQDDLAIITDAALNGAGWGYSGLLYKVDDHANTSATTTSQLVLRGGVLSGLGLIERNTDVDVFSFDWAGGTVTLNIEPFERGPNLDILAELYDAAGVLVASSNPSGLINAAITALLNAGTYYLHVSGTGQPDPLPDSDLNVFSVGYSDYGSLGQYIIGNGLATATVSVVVTPGNMFEESGGVFTYTFTRVGDLTDPLVVGFDLSGGVSFPGDFTISGVTSFFGGFGTITFAAGASTAVMTVRPVDDDIFESTEAVSVGVVLGVGYRVGSPAVASGLIFDDDFDDNFEENDTLAQAADPLGNGGNWENRWISSIAGRGQARDDDFFRINVSPGHLRVIAELDFSHTQGDLDLYLFDSTGVMVARSESLDDDELIDFLVAAPGTYYLWILPYGGPIATMYDLRWDDLPTVTPDVSLAVAHASVNENGAPNLVYTITRTGDTSEALTVSFNVGGTATFNTDYTVSGAASFNATTGTVTIAAGATSASVTINPTGDTSIEADETVLLTLTPGLGYNIAGPALATGTIANDDFPTIAISDASAAEGGQLSFTVTLSQSATIDITVDWSTLDGSALAVADYVAAGGTLNFTAGQTQRTILINTVNDSTPELLEEFSVVLSNPSSGTLSDGTAVGTITNDDFDAAPVVTNVRFGIGTNTWINAADLNRIAPWQIRRIEYSFDRDVLIDVNDLSITGTLGGVSFSGFSYNATTRTAVWTLAAPVERNRLTLRLDGDDASGDSNDGVKAAAGIYPPGGDYLTGGDQVSNLDVLFGDVNGDGFVNITDMLMLRGANGTADPWADINGDGIVNITDMLLLRGRNGTSLP